MIFNPPQSKSTQSISRFQKIEFWLIVILLSMVIIELTNSVRLFTESSSPRKFPYDYVSKGIRTIYTYVRPLKPDGVDIVLPLKAVVEVTQPEPDPYKYFQLEGAPFVYPPTALVELLPFRLFYSPEDVSAGARFADLIGRLCVLATIAVTLWFLRGIRRGWIQWFLISLTLVAAFPLRWMLACVNVQSIITLFLVGAIIAYARFRNLLAGVLVGLAICLKPYLAILMLFAAIRREWRFFTGAAVCTCILIFGSLILMGFSPWQTYLTEIFPKMSMGYAFFANQSINGIVHRWLGHSGIGCVLGPPSFVVSIFSMAAAVIFIALALYPRSTIRHKNSDQIVPTAWSNDMLLRATDIGIALMAVTLSSPTVWEHYFSWSIVLFSICLVINRSVKLPGWFLGLLSCSYILLGTYIKPVEARFASAGPLSLINSPLFIGALLLLVTAWIANSYVSRT